MKNGSSYNDCENMDILGYIDYLDYILNRQKEQHENDETVLD